jgi:hypothetical protein
MNNSINDSVYARQSTREKGKSRYATPRSSPVCREVAVTARSALLDRGEELGSYDRFKRLWQSISLKIMRNPSLPL